MEVSETKNSVQDYYGKTLKSSDDLKTDACCTADDLPSFAKPILSKVHDEVLAKYYGCGIVLPESLKDCSILDLGSGSGRDCYVLSYLVGENGHVVGVDMTDEQLEVANRHKDYMATQYAYKKSNVDFLKGDIEKLSDLSLEGQSFDCIISNCVVNLAEDKQAVLDEAFRLLKNGGEFYFSDVYSDRRIPENLKKDPVLYGECLSGALYWNDFLKMARKAGFVDARKVTSRPLDIGDTNVQAKVGNIQFMSTTYRLFKIEGMEEDCEDYGQAIRYKGGIPNHSRFFQLDEGHCFQAGKIYPVCGNTYLMLKNTRFAEFFEFFGDFSNHYGLYPDCGDVVEVTNVNANQEVTAGSCC
ncbi:MAG: methyltransferase domain-containing protein [Pseudomonadota bacterium]